MARPNKAESDREVAVETKLARLRERYQREREDRATTVCPGCTRLLPLDLCKPHSEPEAKGLYCESCRALTRDQLFG